MHLQDDELSVVLMALELQKENSNDRLTSQMVNGIESKIRDGKINLTLEETQALYVYLFSLHGQVSMMAQDDNDEEAKKYEKASANILHNLENIFEEANIRISDFMTIHPDVNSYKSATRRLGKKVGRNDLCPCGSGKKYKNCCGKPF